MAAVGVWAAAFSLVLVCAAAQVVEVEIELAVKPNSLLPSSSVIQTVTCDKDLSFSLLTTGGELRVRAEVSPPQLDALLYRVGMAIKHWTAASIFVPYTPSAGPFGLLHPCRSVAAELQPEPEKGEAYRDMFRHPSLQPELPAPPKPGLVPVTVLKVAAVRFSVGLPARLFAWGGYDQLLSEFPTLFQPVVVLPDAARAAAEFVQKQNHLLRADNDAYWTDGRGPRDWDANKRGFYGLKLLRCLEHLGNGRVKYEPRLVPRVAVHTDKSPVCHQYRVWWDTAACEIGQVPRRPAPCREQPRPLPKSKPASSSASSSASAAADKDIVVMIEFRFGGINTMLTSLLNQPLADRAAEPSPRMATSLGLPSVLPALAAFELDGARLRTGLAASTSVGLGTFESVDLEIN